MSTEGVTAPPPGATTPQRPGRSRPRPLHTHTQGNAHVANTINGLDLPEVEPTNEELAALDIEVNKILPDLEGEFDLLKPFGGLPDLTPMGLDAFDDLTVYS